LTTLFPIKAGTHCAELRTYLRSLDNPVVYPNGSPLCEVPMVHMARFVIIDRLAYQGFPARCDYLNWQYLLFMCDFDGEELEPLVEAIIERISAVATSIWEHCAGFPGTASRDVLTAYFEKCQLETTLFLADRPEETVSDILKALMVKRAFSQFVAQVEQTQPPADVLQRDFWAMWRTLEGSATPQPGSL